jgi:hypothetical protein
MLIIHSALVSWLARFFVFLSLMSAVPVFSVSIVALVGALMSYPTARMLSEYSPGLRRFSGKM